MNAPAHDLLTRTGQPRVLIVGLMPAHTNAASLTGNLLERTHYPLTIERVGEVVAQGHIEDTGAGISLTLTNTQGVRVLNLHNGTPADATWALAKLLERLT
ncbi:hypothetical protein AAGT95_16815 [Salinicola lusitanus]|uniref:Uncharacterized protein n=1 Tax=Salinicola lusitanus TaxID=1949085 RepID=A0ABZ3CQR3_9GAMM